MTHDVKHLSRCPSAAGMNILVCTPGRLLQHMDETPSFDATNLQVRLQHMRSWLCLSE